MDIVGIDKATSTASEIFGFATSLSVDVVIIIAVFVSLFGFAVVYGKRRIMTFIMSLYLTYGLFIVFPYANKLTGFVSEETFSPLTLGVSVFSVLFFVIYIILNDIICAEFTTEGVRRWVEAGTLSAVATALIFAFSYHVLPIEEIYNFGDQIDVLFSSEQSFFWWLAVPLLGIFLSVWGE